MKSRHKEEIVMQTNVWYYIGGYNFVKWMFPPTPFDRRGDIWHHAAGAYLISGEIYDMGKTPHRWNSCYCQELKGRCDPIHLIADEDAELLENLLPPNKSETTRYQDGMGAVYILNKLEEKYDKRK